MARSATPHASRTRKEVFTLATQVTLEMDFMTELAKQHRMRVYNASADLTAAEISAAMDAIIAENIFNTTGGELTSKAGARLVTKQTADFELV